MAGTQFTAYMAMSNLAIGLQRHLAGSFGRGASAIRKHALALTRCVGLMSTCCLIYQMLLASKTFEVKPGMPAKRGGHGLYRPSWP